MILKQTVAYTRKFLMVLASDHVTGATGATVVVNLSKGPGGAFGAAAGAVTEIANGWYQVALTGADVGTLGDLAYHCTGTAPTCDPTDFKDEVQTQIFTDLNLDATTGRAKIFSNVTQNAAVILPFIMTSNGVPTPGLTGFVAQRNLAGAGFAPCANTVVEDASGWYHILLAATDTNASVVEVHITATNADDRNITLYTQP